jgi:hypothetical protein
VLHADGQPDFRIEDSEEYRARGFSPGGGAFVCATFVNRLSSDSAKHKGIAMAPQAKLR